MTFHSLPIPAIAEDPFTALRPALHTVGFPEDKLHEPASFLFRSDFPTLEIGRFQDASVQISKGVVRADGEPLYFVNYNHRDGSLIAFGGVPTVFECLFNLGQAVALARAAENEARYGDAARRAA